VRRALAPGLALVAILLVPLVAPPYQTLMMLPIMAYGVALLGLNLLFGYTGLLSFGHALFIGIGAYTGAFLTSAFGVRSLELILLVAAVLGAVVAAPVAALCVRYVKIYFGMLTLAFGMVFYTFVLKFYKLTGGDEGMPFLRPRLLGLDLGAIPKTDYLVGPYYYYCVGVLLLATAVMWRIVHSPFGLCLRTIRDNPVKAEALGIGVPRYRWYAFMISAVYAAVGGTLLGAPIGNVDPTLAYWTHSGNLVFMTLLGGFTHFFGPLLGAFVFIYLQDFVMSITSYWRLVFGAILALVVIFAPTGLMGLMARGRATTGLAQPTGPGAERTHSTPPTPVAASRPPVASSRPPLP
jgi:branched-chain amino acid transport system permease protein